MYEEVFLAGAQTIMSDLQSFVCKKGKSLSPSDILAATQNLYEKGFVTYPRTSSSYLCKDEVERVDGIIVALTNAGYCGFVLWKENKYFEALGIKLTKQKVVSLLEKGKFRAKGLKSKKSGKTYDADIVMKMGEKYPEFSMVFPKH